MCQCHDTYGAHLRAKNLKVGFCNSASGKDRTADKKWQGDLAAYASARRQGIQPATTRRKDVDLAVRVSDERGEAFQA